MKDLFVPDQQAGGPARAWVPVLVRGAAALVAALVTTFSSDHSAPVGFAVFGGLTLVTAIALVVEIAAVRGDNDRVDTGLLTAHAALTAVAGILAFALLGTGVATLSLLVIVWAATTGVVELWRGLRLRGASPRSGDLVFAGVLGMLLAIAVVLVPSDYSLTYHVEGNAFQLTGSIIVVGLIGFYAAGIGIRLVIAGIALVRGPALTAANGAAR